MSTDNGRPIGAGSDPANRRPDGRFGPGNTASRGNPAHKRMQEFRRRLLDAVDPAQVEEIGRKLTTLAAGGDLEAARTILPYLLGRPPASVEVSGPDGEPLAVMNWLVVQRMLMDALKNYPEARAKVAEGLMRLHDAGDAGMGGDGA
jgi:hypothetical protein